MRSDIDCKGVKYQEISVGRSIDLSNKTYGQLVCICRVRLIDKLLKNRDTFWLCKCSCGNMGQYYMSQFEYILFFRKGKGVKINNCGTADILSIPNKKTKDENGKNLHDTEKPVELMKILIENSTQENGIVIDPFVGVGSTALACIKSNRRFMCCELDEHYCNIAKDRIEELTNE